MSFKKRLFLTTGLISLLNTLTFIKQSHDICEDYLVIISFIASDKFIEQNKKIASLHNFKEIMFFNDEEYLFKNWDFTAYDEIYSVGFNSLLKNKKNKINSFYLMDEGPGFVNKDLSISSKIKGIFYTSYLDKLEYTKLPKNNCKITKLNTEIFNETCKKVLNLLDEREKDYSKEKNVLFIGHYMFVNGMGKKKALDYYYSNINLFLNNNFTVYFKAHPREIDDTLKVLKEHYKNNSKFKIIENSLPIEAYNNEFSIVAGTFSGTLISVPHFHKIPSASLNCDEMYNSKYSLSWKKFFIISEYYTPCIEFYKEILHLPNKEFREKSKEIYSKYIHSKKQITSNVDLIKILNYKKSLFKDIFYGILNLGTHARKDFYDTIKNIQKEIRKK